MRWEQSQAVLGFGEGPEASPGTVGPCSYPWVLKENL